MNLDMPTCVSIITNNDLDELELILRKKYKKFKYIYRFISMYHTQIETIEYKIGTDESELVIDLDFSSDTDFDSVEADISSIFMKVLEKNPDTGVECNWSRDNNLMSLFISIPEQY